MIVAIEALMLGFVLGAIFAVFRLPIPAPPTVIGVVGILGVTLGVIVVRHFQ